MCLSAGAAWDAPTLTALSPQVTLPLIKVPRFVVNASCLFVLTFVSQQSRRSNKRICSKRGMLGAISVQACRSSGASLCSTSLHSCAPPDALSYRHPGKFSLLGRDFSSDTSDKTVFCSPSQGARQQSHSVGNASYVSAEYPFGPISRSSLMKAKALLQAVASRLQPMEDFAGLSSQFYELVPSFSRLAAPPIINDLGACQRLSAFVDASMKLLGSERADAEQIAVSVQNAATLARTRQSGGGSATVDEYCPVSLSSHV